MNICPAEILDNIIDHLPNDSLTPTLNTLSLVSKGLRHAANRKKFSKVHLSYGRKIDDDHAGIPRYFEDARSHTFKFFQLIQTSDDIAQHVRKISFTTVQGHPSGGFPPEYTEFSSISTILEKTPNLCCISFPATMYDQAAMWNLDIPPILRDAFLSFYKHRGKMFESKFDITGIQNFPAELLRTIPDIDELRVRPLFVADINNFVASQNAAVPNNRPVLMPKSLTLEVPWGLGAGWSELVQLLHSPSSFINLGHLETLNISYYERHLLEIDNILGSCRSTLKNLYLRVSSLTNYTISLVNYDTDNIEPFTAGIPNLEGLQALETLSIVGLVYDRQSHYKTQAHWIADLLASLARSPAFTATLRRIHFSFTLGCVPFDRLSSLDWSPITDVLSTNFTRSRLKQISFTFRMRTANRDTIVLNPYMLHEANTTALQTLQNATGVVTVGTGLDFGV